MRKNAFTKLTIMLSPSAFLSLTSCYLFSTDPDSIPFSKGIYTASYEEIRTLNGKTDKYNYKISSNGNGRKCCFDDSRFIGLRCVDDHLAGKEYGLNTQKKTAVWSLLKNEGKWRYDENWFKDYFMSSQLKSVGESLINGHQCRGYIVDLGLKSPAQKHPPDYEYWFDKDTGSLIYGKSAYETIKLLNYQNTPLPPSSFEIPSDYQISRDPMWSFCKVHPITKTKFR